MSVTFSYESREITSVSFGPKYFAMDFYCPIVYDYQSLNDYRKLFIHQKNAIVNKKNGFCQLWRAGPEDFVSFC